jgi:hypothetical protein
VWQCREWDDPEHSNQWWNVTNKRIISGDGGGMCLRAAEKGGLGILGAIVTTAVCDDADPAQDFFFPGSGSPLGGTIVHNGFCLDAGTIGRTIQFDGKSWSNKEIKSNACPDPGNPPLLPRNALDGYTVGLMKWNNSDRLVILGGSEGDSNVYYSDDCGITFSCFDQVQPWSAAGRSFSPLLQAPGVIPGDPLLMAGGYDYDPSLPSFSTGLYYSFNGAAEVWGKAYDLPFAPVWPGQLGFDDERLYLFAGVTADIPYTVYYVDQNTYNNSGWTLLVNGSSEGSFGRRVYVKGKVSGGCWFSTDYSAGDLWGSTLDNSGLEPNVEVYSMNQFSVARTASGPWSNPVPAPWTARASAAVVSSEDRTAIWFAGGMEFMDGLPSGATFGDVWAIDAAVCLHGTNNRICSGHGTANLDTVTCTCQPAWDGDDRCSSCGASFSGDNCDQCNSPNSAGPDCAPCLPCVHGKCSGAGTTSGDGSCVCVLGWTGDSCNIQLTPVVRASASPVPQPPNTGKPGLSGGAVFAIVASVLLLGGGGGLYALSIVNPAAFAALKSSATAAVNSASKAVASRAGVSGGERTSLLKATPASAALSAEQAAQRFSAVGHGGSTAYAAGGSEL